MILDGVAHVALAQIGTITLDQVFEWAQKLGIAGAFGVMWWFERKEKLVERRERMRLQGVVERYLPVAENSIRVSKAVTKAFGVGPEDGDEGSGG